MILEKNSPIQKWAAIWMYTLKNGKGGKDLHRIVGVIV